MRLSHLMQLQELEDRSEGDPNWWRGVLLRVMDGEGLKEIAAGYCCLGVVLREWIARDSEREDAYQEALERKKEMRVEELLDRTAAAAMANVQDAQTGSGEWLDVQMWPRGLLAAADQVEFGPDGRPYKIKMDAGRHGDRLAKMLGLDKSQQVNVGITSLVNVLSDMPAGAIRQRPGAQAVEDALVVEPKVLESVAQTGGGRALEADAGEVLREREPQGNPPPDSPPRRSVSYEPI